MQTRARPASTRSGAMIASHWGWLQHAHLVPDRVETVECQLASLAAGNHHLSQAFLNRPTDLRTTRQLVVAFGDDLDRSSCDAVARLLGQRRDAGSQRPGHS